MSQQGKCACSSYTTQFEIHLRTLKRVKASKSLEKMTWELPSQHPGGALLCATLESATHTGNDDTFSVILLVLYRYS